MKIISTSNIRKSALMHTVLAVVGTLFMLYSETQLNISKDEYFVFDGIEYMGLYVVGMLICIPVFIGSIIRLRHTRKWIYILPAILSTIGFAPMLLDTFSKNETEVPTILSAHFDGGTNGIGIYLKEDGTYTIHSYAIFGGSFIKGDYYLDGDTIVLDKKDPQGNGYMQQSLLISDDRVLFHLNDHGTYDTLSCVMNITQIDTSQFLILE